MLSVLLVCALYIIYIYIHRRPLPVRLQSLACEERDDPSIMCVVCVRVCACVCVCGLGGVLRVSGGAAWVVWCAPSLLPPRYPRRGINRPQRSLALSSDVCSYCLDCCLTACRKDIIILLCRSRIQDL